MEPHVILGVRSGVSADILDAAFTRRVIGCSLTPHDVTPTSLMVILALGSSGVLTADAALGETDNSEARIAWLRALAGAYRAAGGTTFHTGDAGGPVPDEYWSLCRSGIDTVFPMFVAAVGDTGVPARFVDLVDKSIEASWSWGCRTLPDGAPISAFCAAEAAVTALRRRRAEVRDWSSPQMKAAAAVTEQLLARAHELLSEADAAHLGVVAPGSGHWTIPVVGPAVDSVGGPWRAWRRSRAARLDRQVQELRAGRIRSIIDTIL